MLYAFISFNAFLWVTYMWCLPALMFYLVAWCFIEVSRTKSKLIKAYYLALAALYLYAWYSLLLRIQSGEVAYLLSKQNIAKNLMIPIVVWIVIFLLAGCALIVFIYLKYDNKRKERICIKFQKQHGLMTQLARNLISTEVLPIVKLHLATNLTHEWVNRLLQLKGDAEKREVKNMDQSDYYYLTALKDLTEIMTESILEDFKNERTRLLRKVGGLEQYSKLKQKYILRPIL